VDFEELKLKRILVRIPQWLGDAVVSTIFIKRLKAKNPDAEIHVLTQPFLAEIFETQPEVTGVHRLPSPYRWQVRQVGQSLRRYYFNTVYVLPRSARTAFEAFFSGIPERVGFGGDLRRLFLTRTVSTNKNRRYPHRYLSLMGEENIPIENLRPHFPSEKPNPDELIPLLGGTGALKKPVLGMAPVSIAPARTWDADRFVDLANMFLKEKGGTVVLFGSPGEKHILDEIEYKIEGYVVNEAGSLKLSGLGWLLSQLDCFVGNDSGLMHAASAFKIPSVILFGASDPTYALPVGPHIKALQRKEISCVPCLRNHCVRFGELNRECLKAISVAEVWQTLTQLKI